MHGLLAVAGRADDLDVVDQANEHGESFPDSGLIVGDDELQKGRAVLRDMASKQQAEIAFDNIEAELLSRKAN